MTALVEMLVFVEMVDWEALAAHIFPEQTDKRNSYIHRHQIMKKNANIICMILKIKPNFQQIPKEYFDKNPVDLLQLTIIGHITNPRDQSNALYIVNVTAIKDIHQEAR